MVWGHVVVNQMGIVQVPYATVTVKYFRALYLEPPQSLQLYFSRPCVHIDEPPHSLHVLRSRPCEHTYDSS